MPRKDPPPNPDAEVMEGFPNHGDPHEVIDDLPDPVDDPPEPRETATEKALREMQARLDRQEQELQQLRRSTAPPQPKETTPSAPPSVLDEAEDRLYREPKKFLAEFGNEVASRVTEQVTKSLTSQYQRDRGTQKFWEDFYQAHPDLKVDHDLVEVVLNSNLAEMSSIPVPKAMERLADLTRERILRYTGGAGKSKPKAKAEGAAPPMPKPKASTPEKTKILSISEIIRDRKENRRKRASGV